MSATVKSQQQSAGMKQRADCREWKLLNLLVHINYFLFSSISEEDESRVHREL